MMFYFAEGRSLVALFLFPYHHPSVDSVDSSPLWEPYLPLLEERWHAVSEWWLLFDVLFLSPYHHPSVDSVDSSPLWEFTCLSLRRGGTQCRSGGCYSASFFTFQHVKASRYGLPYLLICCTCVGCVIRCFLSVTAAETRI